MGSIALQVECQTGGQVLSGANVIFDTTVYIAGNILYNETTGIITFLETGRYIFNWWVSSQASQSVNGAVFALIFSNFNKLKGNSPIKTGEVSGGGIIEVDAPLTTVSLANMSGADIFFASNVPVKASLMLWQDELVGPTGDTGPTGPTGPIGSTGATGPTGDTGPGMQTSFVQLYDRNFTNELTASGPLNLSNEGINPLYTTGGYTLATGTVTNDTLNLPGAGLYHLEISLRASFLLPLNPPAFGSTYQILFNILNENSTSISNLVFNGIIPSDPNAVLDNQLGLQFLYYSASPSPSLRVVLSNFDFSLAFDNQLSVFDIIMIVEKWEDAPSPLI